MGTGASGVNYAEGGNGNDTINGAASTVAVTAYGGDGTDIITGGTVATISTAAMARTRSPATTATTR